MKIIIALLLVVAATASYHDAINILVSSVTRMRSQVVQVSSEDFHVLDSSNPLTEFCGNSSSSFVGQLQASFSGFGVGNLDFSALLSCFNSFCGLIGPTGTCSTLNPFFSQSSSSSTCVSVPATIISDNCQNGCFGQFLAPLLQIVPCVLNAFNQLLPQLENSICGMIMDPNEANACRQSFGSFDFSSLANQQNLVPEQQIKDSLARLCYQNPANGLYCYSVLINGLNGLPDSADITDTANCPYFQTLGCCIAALGLQLTQFDGTPATCGASVPTFTAAQLTQAITTCGLSQVPTCPAPGQAVKYVLAHWALSGISYSYYASMTTANQFAFYAALRSDIGAALGLSSSDYQFITVSENVTAITGGVLITFTIRAGDDGTTTTISGQVTAVLGGSGSVSFSAVTTFASTNSGLVSGSVGLDRAGSTASTATQTGAGASGASAVHASLAVLSFAVLLALAAIF